jgi:hypothetical protein
MMLTDQTISKIPETGGAMTSGQKTADIAGANIGSLNDAGAVELSVIARIPDLDAPTPPPKRKHSSRSRSAKPASTTGRLLSAGLSLNLLIGLGLVLLLGAIAPYIYNRSVDNDSSSSAQASGQAWQQPVPAPTADLAPAWKPLAEQPKTSSQLWSNIAESKAGESAPHVPSDNTLTMEKTQTASSPKVNGSDAANFMRRDNNILQSNITAPMSGSQPKATLAADLKPAAEKGSGLTATPQSGDADRWPAAAGQSSSWPLVADDRANFSPWPNPAHRNFGPADSCNVAATPAGPEASPSRANSMPAVANRSAVIGQAPPGGISNPSAYRPVEQYNYPAGAAADPRRIEPITADRRNATAPDAGAGQPLVPALRVPGTAQPRSGNEPGNAQFEGIINTPPDRNTY